MATAVASTSSSLLSFSFSSLSSSSLSPLIRLSLSSSPRHSLSSSLSISPSFLPLSSKTPKTAASSLSFTIKAEKKNVLIVNTNSGGHAVIGFYFAKELLASGHSVTVLTVGEEASDKMKKPPFNRFSEIVSGGGKTVWGDPADIGKVLEGAAFDVVLDNNGKDLDAVSAGIYKQTDEPPHIEGDAVKGDAGHVGVEKYLSDTFDNWSSFRPQYMIGSGNNKDCEEWFFDRIVRGRPVLIPGSGMQLSNISHVRDLSSMLTAAVEKPDAAKGNIFNCVSDRAVTLDGMAKLCAKAAGLPVEIVHYDPKAVGVDAKKAFPFRNMHFYAEPRAAKAILGWRGTSNLPEDLKERYEEYVKIGRDKKEIKFELDDKILAALKVPVTV
ncbi:hypothetical protein SASPL_135185 [Salvia splendens]|uniref:Chloroplast stem-loop binding protein of 41 kDa a, chloroplastic n=1 Tax=Salvia splendens TaxID=180675 RepID=A0A8X8WXP7_SALSN|nr:hypothetical protein SASPL_135185 [Salvia splendens]